MSEWCKSFILVSKANRKVRLYLDPAQLNKTLIRPIHRGPTPNDMLSKLTGVKALILIDVSSGYHNLNLSKSHHIYQHFLVYLASFDI